MFRRFHYEPLQTPEELLRRYLGEAVAAVAGHREPYEAYEALRGYFATLNPYCTPQDWDQGELGVPEPLLRFTEGYTLHLFFRAWLRKKGIDPGAVVTAENG